MVCKLIPKLEFETEFKSLRSEILICWIFRFTSEFIFLLSILEWQEGQGYSTIRWGVWQFLRVTSQKLPNPSLLINLFIDYVWLFTFLGYYLYSLSFLYFCLASPLIEKINNRPFVLENLNILLPQKFLKQIII